ncbi:MAG: hypothetical protein K2X27_18120 [Candidatus Obscuribacterales bacterium]|nr:hypothetical protein [Candidatus Obscuribacterales bacterium]
MISPASVSHSLWFVVFCCAGATFPTLLYEAVRYLKSGKYLDALFMFAGSVYGGHILWLLMMREKVSVVGVVCVGLPLAALLIRYISGLDKKSDDRK